MSTEATEPHGTLTFNFSVMPNRRILDKHFIAELVHEAVSEFSISAGAKHGDNIQGTLLAVDVKTVSKKIIHLVIKSVLPMSGVIDHDTLVGSKFIAALKTYPREVVFYEKVRPVLREALKDKSSGAFSKPHYYSGFLDNDEGLYDFISLEDLRPEGYKMWDKFKSYNFEQATAIMKELAMLHGVSYCLLQGQTELVKMRKDPKMVLNSHEWEKDVMENADSSVLYNGLIKRMLKIVKENGQAAEAEKLEKYTKIGHDVMINLWKKTGTDPKYFPVLLHGDLWTNNILLKTNHLDGKTVEDVKFIDFQLARFGNIYEDFHYFFFCSTTAEFRKNHLKSCFQVYFQEFSKVLSEALPEKYELPPRFTEDSIMSTFLENLDYGLCYGLVAIPFQVGISPPPQSPMTPLEINSNYSAKAFNAEEKGTTVNPKDIRPDFQQYMADMEEGLETATRNSPIALKRLKDMISEMVEHGLIN